MKMKSESHKKIMSEKVMGLKMMPEHPQMSKLNSMKTGMSYKKHKMGSDDSMKSSAKGKSSSDMMGKGQMMMMGGGPMGSYKGDAPSTMKKRMMMTYFKGKGTGEVYPEEEFPKCGCSECDETVWMTPVDEGNVRTCGEKIMELQTAGYGGHYEIEACTIISYLYPSTCGPYCNPNLCGKVEASAEPTLAPTIKPTNPPIVDNRDTLSPTAPPVVETPEPTPSPTTLPTKSPTTSPTKSPTIPPITTTSPPTTKESEETPSPTESPTTSPTVATTSRCGCDLCTNEVLDTEFEGFTCRTRIDFVISEGGLSEDAACTLIANSIEVCRPCHPSCGEDTPSLLPSGAPSDSSSPSLPPSETPTTKSPTNVPTKSPTHSPTKSPTDSPTLSPTLSPTIVDPSTSLDTCACPGCDDVLDVFVDGIRVKTEVDLQRNKPVPLSVPVSPTIVVPVIPIPVTMTTLAVVVTTTIAADVPPVRQRSWIHRWMAFRVVYALPFSNPWMVEDCPSSRPVESWPAISPMPVVPVVPVVVEIDH
eukprot:scaffold1501_cov158-Amphora_coffeaeformis.AAC.8